MLVDLSIIPIGTGARLGDELAGILRIVDASDLPYQLTPTGTCLEGSWDEVMPVVRACHEHAREHAGRVVTTLKIDDDPAYTDNLTRNVTALEDRVGKTLARTEPA